MEKNENTPSVGQQASTSNTESSAEHDVESMPSMEEMLKAAELKAQEHYDAWMYAKADSENIRRRAVDDVSKAHKFAVENFSKEILAVKDSLDAALDVETENIEIDKAIKITKIAENGKDKFSHRNFPLGCRSKP